MAFVGVIMAVLIFSSLCAAILILAEQENLIDRDVESTLKAMYAAEGGIQTMVMRMQDNPNMTFQDIEDICSNLTKLKPAVGEAVIESITAKDSGDNIELTVSAASGNAKKVLVAHISKPSQSELRPLLNGLTGRSGIDLRSGQVIEGDIFSRGTVNLRANSVVLGDIRALGNVSLEVNALVQGDIFLQGTISIAGNAAVSGSINSNLESIPEIPVFPDLDMDFFLEQAAQQEGHYFSNDDTPKTFTSEDLSAESGIYFCDGDMIIDSDAESYSGTIVIAAKGTITVSGDLAPEDTASRLALISSGDIEISNGASITGVIIAGGSLVSNGDPGQINGIAAAGRISSFCGDFCYSPSVLSGLEEYLALEGTPAGLQIWREQYDIY